MLVSPYLNIIATNNNITTLGGILSNSFIVIVRRIARCTVGSRQAEHESQGESMEEDDMVMRVGNSLVQRRTDEGGKGCKPEEHIKRCQGLAEG